jgi:hypothetical protein
MELYEDHKDHRDKFEILAFHDNSAKDFDELDKKCEQPRKLYWQGKNLPFPILLDSTGQTIKTYDIHAFPTTILIDPEGKLVGEAGEEQLEAKLPALPIETRLAKALDKNVTYSFDNTELKQAVEMLSKLSRIPIRLDAAALKTAGITPETHVPYTMSGVVTLRSALNLLLCAYDLAAMKDEKGLVIVHRKRGETTSPELSEMQRFCSKRIEEVLTKPMSFDFKDKKLADVAMHFERATTENFVLDPAARKAGLLDPAASVTGSAKDEPLGKGLAKLLDPLGLRVIVRDEVVIITTKSP